MVGIEKFVTTQSCNSISPRVSVAMLGARMHYAIPRILYEVGMLERLFTDSYIGNKPWLGAMIKAVPSNLRPKSVQRWLGRCDHVLPPELVKSFEIFGLWYAWARYRAKTYEEIERVYVNASKYFSRYILADGIGEPDVLWGFSNTSLELFKSVKGTKTRCILEQAILPRCLVKRLLNEEAARWPGWEKGLERQDAFKLIEAREAKEWELADCIVVGSSFVRDGLIDCNVPKSKIHVVPYGVDIDNYSAMPYASYSPGAGPLKVLYAGNVELRKGIQYLLQAVRRFKSSEIEVKIAGSMRIEKSKMGHLEDNVKFLGHVPRSNMRQLYQWADVFVLPSIVEGSATVTYEALMSGVPVITTTNSGSIVQDGIDGFIVPIRNDDALFEALSKYHFDRELLAHHKDATIKARKTASMERYQADIKDIIIELFLQKY